MVAATKQFAKESFTAVKPSFALAKRFAKAKPIFAKVKEEHAI